MSFSLPGSTFSDFGEGRVDLNAGVHMATSERAVLYVFKPYQNQFRDVAMRPHVYNFNTQFIEKTQELADLARTGSARDSMILASLKQDLNLNDFMMPTPGAEMMFKATQLSHNWRFILMLTDSGNGLIGRETAFAHHSNSNIRRIYTGYFTDEPYNPGTFSETDRTLNPKAMLVITHKTVVGTATEHGRFGSITKLNTTASEAIIHPSMATNMMAFDQRGHSNELFLMTPGSLINSVEDDGSGSVIAMPGVDSNISRDNAAKVMPDVFERTGDNVGIAVGGVMSFQGDLVHRKRMNTLNQGLHFEDDSFIEEGLSRMRLSRYMEQGRSRTMNEFDLDVDMMIPVTKIDEMVNGQLYVKPFDLQRPQYYETVDQFETSFVNMYSSLIADVVSPVASSVGLNSIQFTCEIANLRGVITPNWTTHDAQPMWPVPENDIRQMAVAVRHELVQGIFKTIFDAVGDFRVEVYANTTGHTVVRLSLVEQGHRCQADFERPSCLGGFISPLLGNEMTNIDNTQAIEQLFGVATGTSNPSFQLDRQDQDMSNYHSDRMEMLPWEESLRADGAEFN